MEDFSAFLESLKKEQEEKNLGSEVAQQVPPVVNGEVLPEAVLQGTPEVLVEETPKPATEFSNFLNEIKSQVTPTTTSALTAPEEATVGPRDYTQMTYSEKDLLNDDLYAPIEAYMADRFGVHMKDREKADVVEMFMNNQRGFAAGNSVRALNEISYLNSISEDNEKLVRAGEAYELYQGMQGLFGETTTGEKAEIVYDFARSAVLDPINVLTLGVGKVVSGGGFKLGSQIALISAKQAYSKALAKGLTREAAVEAGQRTVATLGKVAQRRATREAAKRQAIVNGATTTFQRMTTPIALKEAAVMGGLESAISAGTDYLYQDAMLRTAVQEEYNLYQTGLSAVVGLIAGGISGAASNIGTGASGVVAPKPITRSDTRGSKSLGKLVGQTPAAPASSTTTTATTQAATSGPSIPPAGNWLQDVAKGKELTDQDNKFWLTMILGDDSKGLKGLTQILFEDGYTWVPRNSDDKFTNWMGDIIKDADPQDAKQFLKDFEAASGISMVEGKKLSIDTFADTFKRKLSENAQVMNAVGQGAKLLGVNPNTLTLNQYMNAVVAGGTGPKTSKVTSAAAQAASPLGNLITKDIPDFQNNLIRLMVSNLSTTALNVTGFAAASGLNSATDIARAVLLGGQAGLQLVASPKNAKETFSNAVGILSNQKLKAQLTLDPNTTYETFMQYARNRPKAVAELTYVLPGGVESLDKIAKGFDPDKPLVTLAANQVVDVIARANLVSAQDGMTKSIEFLTQMDKFLRRPQKEGGFGMSWNEFFLSPDQHKMMLTERFVNLEARAVDETLKSVFSKSYKGEDFVGEVAGVIEDARNIPGVGLLVPFGRFFNNTVAAVYDSVAIGPLIAKFAGGQQDKMYSEILAKGAVSWGLVYALAERERGYISQGLGWSEEIDEETGEVLDERYEFPYGAYKAAARVLAHRQMGEEIPTELAKQLQDQFLGQLTRQLGEAGAGLGEILTALVSDEGPEYTELLGQAFGNIVSQAVSAGTRPLEPINTVMGLSRGEDFYVPDRSQGEKWINNSLRYVDQGIALYKGENTSPRARSAAEGTPRITPSRFVSTTRASVLTHTEQIMNSIGKPTWVANMASLSEGANNRYDQLYNEIVESNAEQLWYSERFRDADLETKQSLVGQVLNKAADATKTYMALAAAKSGDSILADMIVISKGNSRKLINKVMGELDFNKDFDELTGNELQTLKAALKFRDHVLGVK